ncbi:MAG: hypothetical protein EPN97_06080 [Alphaproteobacteria bacterium]|nr:MAG: hypothetical protein EPN97_06080 [Alphaproteobacteria bacterium]
MSLKDIFARAFFRSPEEAKAVDLEKLQRRLTRLMHNTLDMMLEDEMDRADGKQRPPQPVTVEMVFKNLAPQDITEGVLEKNHALDYLHYLAKEAEAKLTVAVTAEKKRAYFWQDEKNAAPCARLTITIDLGRPYAESRILLAETKASSGKPVCSDVKARP